MIESEFLYKKRIEVGLSQTQIANALGYSVQLISLWESGKNTPSITVLSKYASLLNVDLEGIIYSKDHKTNTHSDEYSFNQEEFSKNLKKLRKHKGITQKELASAISCPTNAIIRFEKGTSTPSIEQLIKLAEYYKVSIDSIYFAKEFEANESSITKKTKSKKLFLPIFLPIFITVSVGGGATGVAIAVNNANNESKNNQKYDGGTSQSITSEQSIEPTTESIVSSEPFISSETPTTEIISSSEQSISSEISSSEQSSSSESSSSEQSSSESSSESTPLTPVEDGYLYFGKYPQSRVTNETLITSLNLISEPNSLGYYEYLDEEYLKITAEYNSIYSVDVDAGYYFDNNERIVEENEYWFKVEPIKWQIVAENENEYFLLSSLILDRGRFDDSSNNYENSELRSWLNGEFYNRAFDGVKDKVLQKEIDNSLSSTGLDVNPFISNNTFDYVSLLSNKEISNSLYSIEKVATVSEYDRARSGGNDTYHKGSYWLRSPNNTAGNQVQTINHQGTIFIQNDAYRPTIGVRPIITIKK